MNNSIVLVCFNPFSIFKKCYDAAINNLSKESEIILVDNHSPDKETRDFIHSIKESSIKLIDAGRNIGCINGFNLGFQHADGDIWFKLDDDTFIETKDADKIIAEYILSDESVAYCAGKIPVAPMPTNIFEFNGRKFGTGAETNFSFLGFKKEMFKRFGPMGPKPEHEKKRLYGMGEETWRSESKAQGLKEVTCLDVKAYHHGISDRLLFSLWKYWYGNKRSNHSYDEFLKDLIEQKRAWLFRRERCPEGTKKDLDEYFKGK